MHTCMRTVLECGCASQDPVSGAQRREDATAAGTAATTAQGRDGAQDEA